MIRQTFRIINSLVVLSFKDGDNNPKRNSFGNYYMPFIE